MRDFYTVITISQDFKTRLLVRSFHTFIRNASIFCLIDVRSHNPLSLNFQRPRWHIARYLDLIPLLQTKPTTSRYYSLWTFTSELPLKKTHLLGRGFHTLIKNVSFMYNRCGISQSSPWGSNILAGTLLNSWLWYHCYNSNTPLTDIVFFKLSFLDFPSKF